jgi:hypothetical protein
VTLRWPKVILDDFYCEDILFPATGDFQGHHPTCAHVRYSERTIVLLTIASCANSVTGWRQLAPGDAGGFEVDTYFPTVNLAFAGLDGAPVTVTLPPSSYIYRGTVMMAENAALSTVDGLGGTARRMSTDTQLTLN